MNKKADVFDALDAAAPTLRRYARALCAGAGAAFADDCVQNALQGLAGRIRDRELSVANAEEARLEAYAALTALAGRRSAAAPPPGPRHPPIVHGLAALAFEDRAVLLLVSLEGYSYEAVARIIGVSRETALLRLRRARAALSVAGEKGGSSHHADIEARRAVAHLRIVK